eukprot:CAMPEP_0197320666 /NCGR_PEP_ID=MMETSP0891-20130614/61113_1 /TAXON_ID=44058 ORGANISM="Aureoumbra lagunensis, Strain CCMP1510" /NCGR_SAMPLE_ID=MMETSP0891 /ASSEMBLY_ACC=CAM_ASM_000534 /LENGTH=726 /DNA_ID=CAMNT_0042812173 /DNA_START=571 /DNA_END=2751 /DNA_ORIENTATION=+
MDETELWSKALKETIGYAEGRDDLANKVGKENNEQVIIDGFLGTADEAIINDNDTRASSMQRSSFVSRNSLEAAASQIWPERFYALTQSALYQAKTAECTEAIGVFLMSPTCAVFETTLRPYSFELVTPQGVLHVHGQSSQERDRWTTELRTAIRRSSRLVSDPLVDAAKNIPLDLYELRFQKKQPLGIVLERSAEWALVKSCRPVPSDDSEEQIAAAASTGSALVSVNGQSCLLKSYADVIKSLTGWQPPLTLTFTRAPQISGWLSKRARGRSGRSGRGNWKQRYVEVAQGKLAYYTEDVSQASDEKRDNCVRGALFLMGCAIALAPKGPETDDQPFCFRLVSGIGVIVFQAETLDDLLRWATTLYHAIAIANGGGYILEMERQKVEGDDQEQELTSADDAKESIAQAQEGEKEESEETPAEKDTAKPQPELQTIESEQSGQVDEQPSESQVEQPSEVVITEPPQIEQPQAVITEPPEVDQPQAETVITESPQVDEEAVITEPPQIDQPHVDEEATPTETQQENQQDDDTMTATPSKRRFSHLVTSQEAVLPPETKPPTQALITPHRDPDDEEDDDDDESVRASEIVVEGAKISATKQDTTTTAPTPAKSTIEEIEEILDSGGEVLTDEELQNTFTLLSNDKQYLNPMQFISLLRSVGLSDHGNLKFELDLFHTFDVRKEGHITKDEFVQGMHAHMNKTELQSSEEMRKIVLGIRDFQHQGTVEL